MPKQAVVDALATIDIDILCDRLISGETQRGIALDLGIGIASLCRWIADTNYPERSARVREARIAAARSYDEKAEQELRDATDQFSLAKAKELAHHYRWKASKSDPGGYGDKLSVDQKTTLTGLTDEQLDARFAAIQQKLNERADQSGEA